MINYLPEPLGRKRRGKGTGRKRKERNNSEPWKSNVSAQRRFLGLDRGHLLGRGPRAPTLPLLNQPRGAPHRHLINFLIMPL